MTNERFQQLIDEMEELMAEHDKRITVLESGNGHANHDNAVRLAVLETMSRTQGLSIDRWLDYCFKIVMTVVGTWLAFKLTK